MKKTHQWQFPLPRTHTGILQGNGVIGTMVHGGGRVLRLTIGRADLWDHRGVAQWTPDMSYEALKDVLYREAREEMREIFAYPRPGIDMPGYKTVLPLGRLDLQFAKGVTLETGTLSLGDGVIRIRCRVKERAATIKIYLDMSRCVVRVALPKALAGRVSVRCVPAWHYIGEQLAKRGFEPPRRFRGSTGTGWVQPLPVDPAIAVAHRTDGNSIWIAVARRDGSDTTAAAVRDCLQRAITRGTADLIRCNERWWRDYWKQVPEVAVPDERLQLLYDYGMYKFAGFTHPDGVPATLQGPWIEEYRVPPWSSDYHFNMNVQICYQPAYHGNRIENLMPLFEMMFDWQKGPLAHYAKMYVGIDDGVMIPLATDDRGNYMRGFWAGSVDHASCGWIAHMMYRCYRYTMDTEFLERAYPFIYGAMRVYEEMLEVNKDGSMLMPIGVSAEFCGGAHNAWGQNASYQLACIHALCEALIDAAAVLKKRPRAIWRRILKKLPKACLVDAPEVGGDVVGIWAGRYLDYSHRHHSHLAALSPFDTLDVDDAGWRDVISRSIAQWVLRGPALWCGWSHPWAACIHARVDNAEAALMHLEIFDRFYTNEGHGTVFDTTAPAISFGFESYGRPRPVDTDCMQMDGGMGAVAALQEMLLHTRRGVNVLFAGAPARWGDVAFKGMRTDGAFLVSAARRGGIVRHVTARSLAGGTFFLRNPWPDAEVEVRRRNGHGLRARQGRRATVRGRDLKINTLSGETVVLNRKQSGQPPHEV